jgi:hypothetical protein
MDINEDIFFEMSRRSVLAVLTQPKRNHSVIYIFTFR